ncbi:unnamed protein product [Cylicocyclus nassatus]|uniref:Uncharacterized protein n=1 Tax=Cylicocyclus nassatus TaxID=53992 RepID=A0AA36GTP9_CYLNA|nr:unnamed protein product [Cylicocyclus nassatus]
MKGSPYFCRDACCHYLFVSLRIKVIKVNFSTFHCSGTRNSSKSLLRTFSSPRNLLAHRLEPTGILLSLAKKGMIAKPKCIVSFGREVFRRPQDYDFNFSSDLSLVL